MMMINLKGNPFYLNEAQCSWVAETLKTLSVKEKVGQLMHIVSANDTEETLMQRYRDLPFGGLTFRAAPSAEIREKVEFLQHHASIPMLISANLESGGSGIVSDGTEYASQLEVAATGNCSYAEELGNICGAEASAVGVNLAFAPVVDIHFNWRNPIVNIRTYGSDPQRVLEMSSAYMRGIARHHVAVSIKHFPGDGVDERDQHLVPSVNSFSCEQWDETYGKVYRSLIEQGAQAVMVGHILQPAYSRALCPGIQDEDILPASLSRELVTGLLRDRLGFNGVVITDSAVMTGLSACLPRRQIPAACINAGCDIFLFGRNAQEDFENLLQDVMNGIVSPERLDEAVTRILALKASLGLSQCTSYTRDDYASIIGCKAFSDASRKCADDAITLVKDTQHLLPLSPHRHHRVWLHILGDEPSFRGGMRCQEMILSRLQQAGFEVTLFDRSHPQDALRTEYVSVLKQQFDLILYIGNVTYGRNDSTSRLSYVPIACGESPQYVKDIPTLFISLCDPYHLVDVPMIPTYINCYNCSPVLLDSLFEKLLGRDSFRGVSPVDPFCGIWGTQF